MMLYMRILFAVIFISIVIQAQSPQLVYSTFIGGNGNDAAWLLDDMAIDDKGNICFALNTDSPDFPVTENAYDKTYNGGNNWGMEDITIVKFNIEKNHPEYSTYFGGSGPEFVTQVLISGNDMYLTGNLGSKDFPVTENAFDRVFKGPDFRHADGFISKFEGNKLVYSSFIGTSGNEGACNLSINNKHELILVTQLAKPGELKVTNNFSHKTNPDLPYACVLRLNTKGDSLLSISQLGGVWALSSAIDDSGYIYLTGSTSDTSFPVTNGAYNINYNGGIESWKGDFFITKLSPDAGKIIFSTYIGGTGDESFPKIVIDNNYNIILFGVTESNDYPITQNALQSIRKGERDFVITKLSHDGKKIIYSSLLGSNENSMESNGELIIHENGDVFLAGSTDGEDFPVTQNAICPAHKGKKDIFLTVLNNTLDKIKYSTYLGGKEDDMLPSLIFKDGKNIVITGTTSSPGFPVTENCYDRTLNGGSDVFITQIKLQE